MIFCSFSVFSVNSVVSPEAEPPKAQKTQSKTKFPARFLEQSNGGFCRML